MRDDWQQKLLEWRNENKYCSYNSFKGLMYTDSHYKPIAQWWEGKGELPPPVELSLDPSHLCNFKCPHCNAQRYLVHRPEEVPRDRKVMTKEHLQSLIDFCSEWGVEAVCMGGGGEPLMNKNVWEMPSYIHKRGMQSSFATNGSLIDERIANEMMYCRWVGVSVDAGTRETYEKVHGVDCFDRVIKNLELLVKTKERTGSLVDISYKFLLSPLNWHEVEIAYDLARSIGVQGDAAKSAALTEYEGRQAYDLRKVPIIRDFHVRPTDLERKDFESAIAFNYNYEKIQESLEACRRKETEAVEQGQFITRLVSVLHKYNPEFKSPHHFHNCIAASLMVQACADGYVYICADHRIEKRFRLGSHYPDPKSILAFWGKDAHRKIAKSIVVDKECGRCTYGEYNRQLEENVLGIRKGKNGEVLIDSEPMCRPFP